MIKEFIHKEINEVKQQSPENFKSIKPEKQMSTKELNNAVKEEFGKENKEVESEKTGGSYKEVYKPGEGDTKEVHHTPADSESPLERDDGPAIKMDKADHRMTASCGNSLEAREYRAKQKELIDSGKFREAVQMDIDDIRGKFGDKYDKAIGEMLNYVDKLEKEGMI